jgi:hypothetical protein
MWVTPNQRGTGLAGQLIGQVVAWAAARGQGTSLMVRGAETSSRLCSNTVSVNIEI